MKGRGCYWIKSVSSFTSLLEDELIQCKLDQKMCVKECSFYRRLDVTFVEFKGESYWSFKSEIKVNEFIEQHYKKVF